MLGFDFAFERLRERASAGDLRGRPSSDDHVSGFPTALSIVRYIQVSSGLMAGAAERRDADGALLFTALG